MALIIPFPPHLSSFLLQTQNQFGTEMGHDTTVRYLRPSLPYVPFHLPSPTIQISTRVHIFRPAKRTRGTTFSSREAGGPIPNWNEHVKLPPQARMSASRKIIEKTVKSPRKAVKKGPTIAKEPAKKGSAPSKTNANLQNQLNICTFSPETLKPRVAPLSVGVLFHFAHVLNIFL